MDFSQLEKKQKQSFAAQKNLLKRLSSSKEVLCETCNKPIKLAITEPGFARASCDKGCTDILCQLG